MKPKVTLIVAQSQNRVIGRGGVMPWHLPRDLAWFRRHTEGHCVVMGRKTFAAIGRPLPRRRNIVLSRHCSVDMGVEVVRSAEALWDTVRDETEIFVIGGAELYRLFWAQATRLLVTEIEVFIADGDAFFPPIAAAEWTLSAEKGFAADEKNAYALRFCEYLRK